MVKDINEKEFEQEVLSSKIPVFVDFWAEWCGPCRMLSPVIEELSKMYQENQIKIFKVNVDSNPKLAAKYGIMAIPTIIIFKDGKPFEQTSGVKSKQELQKMIERVLNTK
ncbi:MAG: thioredoxin [Elusimicrobiota bacterium]|nr:thioredoxin [Endomicrobiia bacterium]MDW8165840.1 thioredoxin [Elusimicrobiota bacterium]